MSWAQRPYAYSKMDKQDPEEQNHRRAQFLIYKVMQQADSQSRQSSLRLRICRLKIKIGKRFKRLLTKKNVLLRRARVAVYKQVMRQLMLLRRLLCTREPKLGLPPMFN